MTDSASFRWRFDREGDYRWTAHAGYRAEIYRQESVTLGVSYPVFLDIPSHGRFRVRHPRHRLRDAKEQAEQAIRRLISGDLLVPPPPPK